MDHSYERIKYWRRLLIYLIIKEREKNKKYIGRLEILLFWSFFFFFF